MSRPTCFFRERGGCDGRIDRAHWVPQQHIKREFRYGLMRSTHDGTLAACRRNEDYVSGGIAWEPVSLDLVLWDPRVWAPICRKHHGDFDAHRFRIGRDELPEGLEEFATQYGLLARLDVEFGVDPVVRNAVRYAL